MSDKRKPTGNYHNKAFKKHRKYDVGPNMAGFLCTFNFQDKGCQREAYNILNKYADKLYGPEISPQEAKNEENDIEHDLESELNQLKAVSKAPFKRRFQVLESGAKNILFVKSELPDTVKIASEVVKEIYETQQQQSRHLIRLIPIEVTTSININDIKAAVLPFIERHFKESPQKFSVICNVRNNGKIVKMDIIKEVADLVSQQRDDHSVNLKQADVTIVIEIIKSVAMLAVIPEYLKYKKFNLILGNNEDAEKTEEKTKSEDTNDSKDVTEEPVANKELN